MILNLFDFLTVYSQYLMVPIGGKKQMAFLLCSTCYVFPKGTTVAGKRPTFVVGPSFFPRFLARRPLVLKSRGGAEKANLQ